MTDSFAQRLGWVLWPRPRELWLRGDAAAPGFGEPFDAARDLVFLPPGNTGTDFSGGQRNNLDYYSSSVAALRGPSRHPHALPRPGRRAPPGGCAASSGLAWRG